MIPKRARSLTTGTSSINQSHVEAMLECNFMQTAPKTDTTRSHCVKGEKGNFRGQTHWTDTLCRT